MTVKSLKVKFETREKVEMVEVTLRYALFSLYFSMKVFNVHRAKEGK